MPREDWKNLPRLHVNFPLAADAPLRLEAQRHYIVNVMRRGPGDEVLLFNGHDGEWRAVIAQLDKKSMALTCREQTRAQEQSPDIALFFAPIKREHLDFMVQKATELGVRRLCPVTTQHTSAGHINPNRLEAVAREAAEQCERLDLPVLEPLQPLVQALAGLAKDQPLFACLETGTAQPILAACAAHAGRPAALLTGPEGGFSEQEMTLLRNHASVIPVSLGRRILRADTAALAALACWQALCGDWRSG